MTTAFVGLLFGVLVISFAGIMSARAAKKHEKLERSPVTGTGIRSRTLDHAAKMPRQDPDRNKSSNDAIGRALAGTSDQSARR